MTLVTRRGHQLLLQGQPYRFVGTNAYFLQEEGAREALGWEGYAGRVDEALRKAAGLGLGVVRAWACHDDPDNPAAIQVAPGEYLETGLAGVDLALQRAAHHGVRLVLSLVNYWPDYGGVPQYLRWHGLPDAPHHFFVDEAVQAHFAENIEAVLTRVNPRTGLRWGDDPAVLGWELCNEPRGAGLNDGGEALAAWAHRMASVVRRHAKQLVLTGEEGHDDDGCDFDRNSAAVDVASAHLYPEHWGWEKVEAAGVAWIRDRARRAQAMGRPLLLGEWGLDNTGLPLPERRRIYRAWLQAAYSEPAVCGAMSWSFSTDDRPDDWDNYTWTWRDGTSPDDPVNRYADLHRDAAARWAAP